MSQLIEVQGLQEIRGILDNMIPRESGNLLRATVLGAAGIVRDLAKKEAPVKTGTLKKSIKSRRVKSHPQNPIAEVYTEKQGFYWIFVNYGTSQQQGSPNNFRDRAVAQFNQQREKYLVETFNKKLAAKIKREQKRLQSRG